jgi:hypothetical protein
MPVVLQQYEWKALLKEIQAYYGAHIERPPRGFISFAWEKEKDERKVLQNWLENLHDSLLAAGLPKVFLDIRDMHGNLRDTMRTHLCRSNLIFFILNTRFIERLAEPDSARGLGFEVDLVSRLT